MNNYESNVKFIKDMVGNIADKILNRINIPEDTNQFIYTSFRKSEIKASYYFKPDKNHLIEISINHNDTDTTIDINELIIYNGLIWDRLNDLRVLLFDIFNTCSVSLFLNEREEEDLACASTLDDFDCNVNKCISTEYSRQFEYIVNKYTLSTNKDNINIIFSNTISPNGYYHKDGKEFGLNCTLIIDTIPIVNKPLDNFLFAGDLNILSKFIENDKSDTKFNERDKLSEYMRNRVINLSEALDDVLKY